MSTTLDAGTTPIDDRNEREQLDERQQLDEREDPADLGKLADVAELGKLADVAELAELEELELLQSGAMLAAALNDAAFVLVRSYVRNERFA